VRKVRYQAAVRVYLKGIYEKFQNQNSTRHNSRCTSGDMILDMSMIICVNSLVVDVLTE